MFLIRLFVRRDFYETTKEKNRWAAVKFIYKV